jgi:hypothetical protein
MSKSKAALAAWVLLLAGAIVPRSAIAQSSPPPAKPLVLVPYESPGSTDPHAATITKTLAAALTAAGMSVTTVAPVDHLDAVADAAKLCADNGAAGLLVPEGRYEQTKKVIPAPFVTVLRYPTHVDFRLDEIGCDGSVRWSATTSGDDVRTGAFSVGNLGSSVDAAFRIAVEAAVKARASASVAETTSNLAAPAAAAAPATTPVTYVVVPFEQPTFADPHSVDMTHSLLTQLQKQNVAVKAGTAIDHLAVVSTAAQLCTANTAQAIIVPDVRIEQSSFTGRSHAALRLALVSCTGTVLAHGAGEADMGSGFMVNFGAAAVGVSERAMGPAIDQLFAAKTKSAT